MRTVLMDLPYKVKGFVAQIDGEEIIVLNSHLSYEANQLTYLHELKHIANKDLTSPCEVNIVEMIRHN